MVSCTSAVSWVRSPPAVCLEVLQEVARPEQTLAGLLNKRELISSSKLYTGQRHTEHTGQSHTKMDRHSQENRMRRDGKSGRKEDYKEDLSGKIEQRSSLFTIKQKEQWKDVHSHAHIHLISFPQLAVCVCVCVFM